MESKIKNKTFENKSPDFGKLINYGFKKNGGKYSYSTEISNGQFEMFVDILDSGEVETKVTDSDSGEPYTLHLLPEAEGAFIGSVRAEYENVLANIAENCFNKFAHKSEYANKVIEYVREKYGDELQFLWSKFPTYAVWRRKDNGKWYGILMTLSQRKLGLDCDDVADVIDLRIAPNVLPDMIDGKKYFAGYHMNKKTWFTMLLDGSVSVKEICEWIDKSYTLAK